MDAHGNNFTQKLEAPSSGRPLYIQHPQPLLPEATKKTKKKKKKTVMMMKTTMVMVMMIEMDAHGRQ